MKQDCYFPVTVSAKTVLSTAGFGDPVREGVHSWGEAAGAAVVTMALPCLFMASPDWGLHRPLMMVTPEFSSQQSHY